MINIRKGKKIITISMTIVIGAIMLLYVIGMSLNTEILHIPNKNDVSFIEIYADYINDISKYHKIEGNEDISEVYNILLSGKKSKTMESVNDSPTNVKDKVTRIVLTDSSNNDTVLFVYEGNNGKYYIEKPYEGIYKISVQEYEILTKYL